MSEPSRKLTRKRPGDPVLDWQVAFPAGETRAAVLLTHGYGEHRRRYAHVVEAWTSRGIAVATWDLRGHGESEGPRGHVESFSDYVRDALDLADALDELRRWSDCGKAILFGHSLGGLISTEIALAAPARFRALALSSPFLGLALEVPAVKRLAGRVMSRVLPTFGLPTGLSGHDLTHDAAIAAAYDRDPLGVKNATARWFTEAMAAQVDARLRAPELRLPVFCLHAADDKVASAAATESVMARVGSPEVRFEKLPGLYHEILNELSRDEVAARYADVFLAWAASGG